MARLRDSSNLHRNYHKKRHIRKGAFTLKHTDNLNHALQGSSMSAGQGQQVAEEVCKTLSIGIEVKPHLTSFGRGC